MLKVNWRAAVLLVLVVDTATPASVALAWGQIGHATITQVAARMVAERSGRKGDDFALKPFRDKELMLAHLSNVPDIVWKDLPREKTKVLNPAHWINFEYFGMHKVAEVRRMGLGDAAALAERHCLVSGLADSVPCVGVGKAAGGRAEVNPKNRLSQVFAVTGSAPWRVQQLADRMQQGFEGVNKKSSGRLARKLNRAQETAVNDALTAAGLLAHFIGDLSQPFHTTLDFDGYKTGQGGIHSYFESEVVAAFGLDLGARVHARASGLKIADFDGAKLFAERDALGLSFLLAANSFGRLDALRQLDAKISVTKPSKEDGAFKVPAVRRPAHQVWAAYEDFVVERLAAGAVVLAEVYWRAWQDAGAPDLSRYATYFYRVSSPPVMLDYLDPTEN